MMSPTRREFLRLMATGAAVSSAVSWAQTPQQAGTTAPPAPDEYGSRSRAAYDQRRQALLEYSAAASPGGRTGFWSQFARLELGRPIDERPLREAIDFVCSNQDCNDFTVGGLLRLLYRYRDQGRVPAPLIEAIQTSLLKFKYWWDEPGTDNRCYHTENHQIIFHMDQLLAGQLYPDRVFDVSGRTGRDHVAFALPLVRRWLDWRVRFGFSEWLSNCYFVEDLMALTNLRDFAAQPDIRSRAEMLIDVLLFEMATSSTSGRPRWVWMPWCSRITPARTMRPGAPISGPATASSPAPPSIARCWSASTGFRRTTPFPSRTPTSRVRPSTRWSIGRLGRSRARETATWPCTHRIRPSGAPTATAHPRSCELVPPTTRGSAR
jgi:hypothetical protein